MKTQILLMITVLLSGGVFGQAFQKTIYNPEKHFNHYSIENIEGGYICVGTLFGKDNNDIHIISLSNEGDVLWERVIDRTEDDRGLDVLVDPSNDIILTGYISPGGVGSSNLYVAKLDIGGDLIGDRSLINTPQVGSPVLMTAGSNIIYSKEEEQYIVGGIITDKMVQPLDYNYCLLVSFDLSLNILETNKIFAGSGFQSINDIVEVRDGYFITGGLKRPDNRQGVLAAVVDYELDITKNFSFDDLKADKHIGVSVLYDEGSDDIYLMSNNSAYHNPQITTIHNVSDNYDWCTSDISYTSYLLVLDDRGSFLPAGYKLEPSLTNPDYLVASGYFKKRESDYGESGTTAWMVEFDKETGGLKLGMEWAIAPSVGFMDQEDVLSEYRFNAPLYYNQEMMTKRNDERGYVMITPRLIRKRYSLELMTTNINKVDGCFNKIEFRPKQLELRFECIDQSNIDFVQYAPELSIREIENEYAVVCKEGYYPKRRDALSTHELEAENTLMVYPNPANKLLTVEFPDGAENGKIEVIDLAGKVVIQNDMNATTIELNIETLENGIYFIKYSTLNGEVYKSKFVKSN